MRKIFVFLLISAGSMFAGILDVAVIQFPEVKTAGELDSALSRVNLAEVTNSDRTMSGESYLKGGYVSFAQSLPVNSGQRFSSATRLKNDRADVSGVFSSGNLSISIALSEGVDAGLRRFSKRVFAGSGPLPAGPARVIGIRQVTGKTQSTIKGQATIKDVTFCSVIVAQFRN
jgi:hypothetical protein